MKNKLLHTREFSPKYFSMGFFLTFIFWLYVAPVFISSSSDVIRSPAATVVADGKNNSEIEVVPYAQMGPRIETTTLDGLNRLSGNKAILALANNRRGSAGDLAFTHESVAKVTGRRFQKNVIEVVHTSKSKRRLSAFHMQSKSRLGNERRFKKAWVSNARLQMTAFFCFQADTTIFALP